jgi:glycosyltransferase involved in cell wall biosynthesis
MSRVLKSIGNSQENNLVHTSVSSSDHPIRISHFATSLNGGAGVAAQRLNSALVKAGLMSSLLFREGNNSNLLACNPDPRYRSVLWRNLNSYEMQRQWNLSNNDYSLFTNFRWIYKTRIQDFGSLPQIINLHWISRWIDQPIFFASIPTTLPIVWSLHDMNPLTGGCHHALGCDKFMSHCGNCPNLKQPASRDAAWKNFRIKAKAYQSLNLHIVGNSTWTTDQAQKSALLKSAQSFQTIPLGLDTTTYAPVPQKAARESLRINSDEFTIGFACADITDQNKNFAVLLDAIQSFAKQYPVTLIVFGAGSLPTMPNNIKVVELGSIHSPTLQCIAYSAADVFVMPSQVESFGLTALEAMACGTPVIAYRTGGLPDLVASGQTGWLIDEVGSDHALQQVLVWMKEHPEERRQMSFASRQRVEQHFNSELMAERYAKLYQSLVKA